MAVNLKQILPRSPAPNSTSPNSGIRSDVTHFITASGQTSSEPKSPRINSTPLPTMAGQTASAALPNRSSLTFSDEPTTSRMSFGIARPSMSAGSRRGIAHSSKVLGVESDAQEAFALQKLVDGKVDVSISSPKETRRYSLSGSLESSSKSIIQKGKTRFNDDPLDGDHTLFQADVDADLPPIQETEGLAEVDVGPVGSSATLPSHGRASDSRVNLIPLLTLPHQGGHNIHDDHDMEAGDDSANFFTKDQQGTTAFGMPVGFETITVREVTWMWTSTCLVFALCLVATLISTDVIDWPGDGLGQQ